jgi:polar amino acid transport system ATP-binding protein
MAENNSSPAAPIDTSIIVKAEKVNKYFGSLHVLKDIDLEVRKNEVVVIIGPSGSGKSTLLRCINHLEKINSGHIFVNGRMIGYYEKNGKLLEESEKNIARQRADIGMVFQRFNLFPHLTAMENIIEAPIRP